MKQGDFLLVEFTGRVKLTGEIFDLTSEEDAKKEGLYSKEHKYGPGLVVLGARMAMPGVEEQLKEMKAGEEKEFEIPPAKAFGLRDRKLIKIVSANNFYKQNMNPVPGAMVTIDGRDCKIKSVSGGRVMIDFNHPLAGKDLLYRIKITRKLADLKEKSDLLLEHYGIQSENTLDKEKGVLGVKTDKPIPPAYQKVFEQNIKKWLPELKLVKFSSKEAPKKEKPAEAKPEPPVEKKA